IAGALRAVSGHRGSAQASSVLPATLPKGRTTHSAPRAARMVSTSLLEAGKPPGTGAPPRPVLQGIPMAEVADMPPREASRGTEGCGTKGDWGKPGLEGRPSEAVWQVPAVRRNPVARQEVRARRTAGMREERPKTSAPKNAPSFALAWRRRIVSSAKTAS